MRNGFFGLGHNSIVSRDNQNRNIGNISAACSHFSKCFVAWRIHKGYRAPIFFDLISTNLLRNPARLTRDDLGANQIVEQRCFAVIDVPKERYDRWTRDQVFLIVLDIIDLANQTGFKRFCFAEFQLDSEIRRNQSRLVLVKRGIDGGHGTHRHQRTKHACGGDTGRFRETPNRAGHRENHFLFANCGWRGLGSSPPVALESSIILLNGRQVSRSINSRTALAARFDACQTLFLDWSFFLNDRFLALCV